MTTKQAVTRTETTVKHFYDCPCCATGTFSYGHLRDSPSGMNVIWTCTECGAVVKAEAAAGAPDVITLTDTGRIEHKHTTLVLLRYSASTPERPFYIIVASSWNSAYEKPVGESDAYLYNEHQCPWNFLQMPTLFAGDNDYHGLFEHVKTVLAPTLAQALVIDPEFDLEIDSETDWLRWADGLQEEQWEMLFFPNKSGTLSLTQEN